MKNSFRTVEIRKRDHRILGLLLQISGCTYLFHSNKKYMAQRVGIIDMGTNTFHLLIAEIVTGKAVPIVSEKVAVGLGRGGINKDLITDEAMDRALNTLKNFRETLNHYEVEQVIATGTSAVRNASNKDFFIKRIEEEAQIKVQVIDGAREAELIFRGVAEAISIGEERSLIMDIGGGSVEFIIGNDKGIIWKQSFEIGGQRLIERFHRHDPITTEETEEMNTYFDSVLLPLQKAVEQYKPTVLIGSSGTFDTLAEMNIDFYKEPINIHDQTSYLLSGKDFTRMKDEMIRMTRTERLQISGMIELRVDMVVVAVCLIQYIYAMIQVHEIMVSTYALKEGVLYTLLDGI